MTKTILFFTGIFFMALIACTESPQEPEEPLTGAAALTYKDGVDLMLFANGNIASGILEEDQEINGVSYAGDTKVSFYESGEFMSGFLVSGQTLDVGGNDIVFDTSFLINFHENGTVKSGRLVADVTLDVGVYSITFLRSAEINFHENGTVKEGFLNSDQTLQVGENSVFFLDSTEDDFLLKFYEDGTIESGFLSGEQGLQIGGGEMEGGYELSFRNQSKVSFHENGEVKSGRITQSQMSGNISFPSGNVNFDEDGVYLP